MDKGVELNDREQNSDLAMEKRIRAAALSGEPISALSSVVHELSHVGRSKAEIYQLFEQVMLAVRAEHDEQESEQEDALLDIMDLLVGFCDRDRVLLPGEDIGDVAAHRSA